MVLDGEIHGKSGHAARGEGINAIYKAIDIVNRLRNLTFPAVSRRLGPIRINVTQIEAGTQHNVVPDLCKNSRRRAHDRCLYERTNLATHSRCRPRMLAHSSKRAIAPIIDSGNPSARCAPHVCRKNAVWLAHSERPSVNAVPFPEIRPRRLCPFAYRRRIHPPRRNPRSHPNLLYNPRRPHFSEREPMSAFIPTGNAES